MTNERRLVVTADDFGVSLPVNDAVEQAHRDGILTAASLMVTGDAVDDAVARARALPLLGVGLHLVLVEGRPALPPERVPSLVGADGLFRTDMVGMAFAIALSAAARRQLEAEIEAQFAAFAATGLPLDHVNAHKHFHLHPMIASTILKVGRRFGMKSVRAPVEHGARGIESWWAGKLQKRLRRAGLSVPDQVVGLAWSGAFDAARMQTALADLHPGLTEIYTHPATADVYPGSAPGYRYRDELAALVDPVAKSILVGKGVRHGNFSTFA
ncbi:hopanoid biosynthesis-associated protein HpnK [Sphingomonas sp. AP4-R1]|uniref:hopanoid biosynthesis-associated protein HpnK n=1 Tax=Sphingomonas sp. AP4-R1 TaxID=2735134 RepID=UPI0014933EFE|nr:hopanoid biosynthesis-associated protein HpnK [Sphingomonas sp. AP4-R1]QJU57507.1 hopanoid biosynthesis-associated protein HpnK [Sphingomonas sp. AP4-R1]